MILLPVFSYWVKMLLLSAILLGYYHLFLRRSAVHAFNRYYLLAALFLSIQLPLWRLPLLPHWTDPVNRAAMALARPHGPHSRAAVTEAYVRNYSDFRATLLQHPQYVVLPYILVTLALLWPLGRSLWTIRRLKRSYRPEKAAEIDVYSTREPGSPFSYFRHLFWNEDIATDTLKGRLIFRHELYHIRELHTLDILAVETIRRLFWCNPFFEVFLRDLKQTHEFLADQYALRAATGNPDTPMPETAGTQRAAYAEWLVWQSQGRTTVPGLVHSFYHTALKRRITLILNPAPARAGKVYRWLTLPLVLLMAFAFAAKDTQLHKMKRPYSDDPILQNAPLTLFYRQHLSYPLAALKKGMQGAISFSVTIDNDGRMNGFEGFTEEMDTEDGKIPTLTITSPPLSPSQQTAQVFPDTARSVFVRAAMEATEHIDEGPALPCPPGTYYFSVEFNIR